MPVEDAASAEASPAAAASAAPSPAARSRTPWFPILAAGTLGAGLAVLAGGAAWVYFAPLDDRGTEELSARLARVELQTQSAAQVAAATVPDMGKVPAAKIEELAERLAKLESAPPRLHRPTTARPNRQDQGAVGPACPPRDRVRGHGPGERPHRRRPRSRNCRPGSRRSSTAATHRRPRPIRRWPAGSPRSRPTMKPLAEHVTELDRQNGDNASTAKEARERSEAVAKAMAEVNRADADQDKKHQSAQAELAGLNSRLDAVETLAKAIRDQVAESAAPKADEPLRFALGCRRPAIRAGARRAVHGGIGRRKGGRRRPCDACGRRALRGHRRAESAGAVPRAHRADPARC